MHEQRPAALERPVQALVLHERPLHRVERRGVVSVARVKERSRPRCGGETPRPVESLPVRLELGSQLSRLVELAEPDERLDQVGVHRVDSPFTEPGRPQPSR